jgi:hypothetical protein
MEILAACSFGGADVEPELHIKGTDVRRGRQGV